MKTTTTTATPAPINIGHLTIYFDNPGVYSHDVFEFFHLSELTDLDLEWIEKDLSRKFGKKQASEIMQQLTANK